MRSRLLCVLALSLLVVDAAAQRPEGGRWRGRGRSVELRDVTLHHFDAEPRTIDTPSLERGSIECMVYVPKAAAEAREPADATAEKDAGNRTQASETRYPWVLWLHGLNDGFFRFQNEGGAETLDALRDAGDIPDLVVVVPTVARQTLYVDGETNGDVEKAVCHDVVDWAESHLPVEKGPEYRALMGVSMGGYGALKIAMRHPDVFPIVAAHSSAILPADPKDLPDQFERYRGRMAQMLGLDAVFGDPIDADKWAANMPLGLVRDRDAEAFAGMHIYFDAGTDDRYGFAPLNEQLDQAMTAKHIEHTFRLVEGGGHSWGSESMRDNLKHSLEFVAAAWGEKPAKPDDHEPAAAGKPRDPHQSR